MREGTEKFNLQNRKHAIIVQVITYSQLVQWVTLVTALVPSG